jgi:hypothetical protein
MEVSGQLYASTVLSPAKEPPPPIGQEAGWAPVTVWLLWRIFLPLREWNPSFSVVQPVAVTIPTELPRLCYTYNCSRSPPLLDCQIRRPQMRAEVLMAVRVTILILTIMEPCHFVGGLLRFGEFFCLNLQSRREDRGTW